MKRRDFIKIAGTLPFIYSCNDKDIGSFDIEVVSNHSIGHLVRDYASQEAKILPKGKIAIIGGGIAGLSAAYQLKDQDFTLFELNDYIGGTSGSIRRYDTDIALGAHYDLAYPKEYGREALKVLKELNIIKWNEEKEWWSFVDYQYIIPSEIESRIFENGAHRFEFFTDQDWFTKFKDLMISFEGQMNMPLGEINQELNNISFYDFIFKEIGVSRECERLLDYHMKDDFGASCKEVSALAGLNYYACRPYYSKGEELFSPPQGNAYFANKLLSTLKVDQVKENHVVTKIQKKERTFIIDLLNIENEQFLQQEFDRVIYAGKQHGLSYVFPEISNFIKPKKYAPWCVVSLILDDFDFPAYWQNELIGMDEDLLGFVDSGAQYQVEGKRFLNVYYCLKENDQEKLIQWAKDPEVLVQKTIRYIQEYFGETIRDKILKAIVHPIGHGMPIPEPGYVGDNLNDRIPFPNFAVAGVDNGRLPLFFEALDSGIEAAKKVRYED